MAFGIPLGLMIALNQTIDNYVSENKTLITTLTNNASDKWNELESVGSLVLIDQNIENRRAFVGFKSVVSGSIVRTDKISVPVQSEIKYYKVGQDDGL